MILQHLGLSSAAHHQPLAKELCMEAAWSAPNKTTWVFRCLKFKPGAIIEEIVISLIREVMGSCSTKKLQQKLWRWHVVAAPVAQGPEQHLLSGAAGAAGPAWP